MGTRRALQEVDPLSLPQGMRIGPWRICAWRGRGAYGTLYRVERAGREADGPFALKLAIHPGDERFEREAKLLSRIPSPHVPSLYDAGVWEHPSGAYPYLVMEWIEGEPLYEWAARRNPTERQALSALAQVARALEATHAVGGVHRDVKGGNVLVRPRDGWAFLMDFGAGHYRGAATLTSKLLPPGTPAYRSPEAWAFVSAFRRHPTAHYPASACDDLFALGVMAYRLVTDEYPPPTHPDEPGAQVWREGGPGPRPPRALNPHVSPELEALILRLLAVAPEERFQGDIRKVVKALEKVEQGASAGLERRLFSWGHAHDCRWRSRTGALWAEEQDAAAQKDWAQRQAKERAGAEAASRHVPLQNRVSVWGVEGAVAALGLLLTGLLVASLYQGPVSSQTTAERGSRTGDGAAVGDSASAAGASTQASASPDDARLAVGASMPEKPLPGQSKPPCKKTGEVEIRGGCWYRLADIAPPCKEKGKEEGYAWKGLCYAPSYPPGRQPTSDPP